MIMENMTGASRKQDLSLEVRPSEQTGYKRHIVFPQVIVNQAKALLFAHAIQKHLNFVSHMDITFDTKLYQKGSLRMLGSCKSTGLVAENKKRDGVLLHAFQSGDWQSAEDDYIRRI